MLKMWYIIMTSLTLDAKQWSLEETTELRLPIHFHQTSQTAWNRIKVNCLALTSTRCSCDGSKQMQRSLFFVLFPNEKETPLEWLFSFSERWFLENDCGVFFILILVGHARCPWKLIKNSRICSVSQPKNESRIITLNCDAKLGILYKSAGFLDNWLFESFALVPKETVSRRLDLTANRLTSSDQQRFFWLYLSIFLQNSYFSNWMLLKMRNLWTE